MKIPFVDLKAGYLPLKTEILKAVEGVLDGMNLFLGPNVQALEKEFAAYCGTRHAVGVGSGTDAIALALMAAGIGRGDEVITTPHTFFATAEAIVWAGATPVFVDIDPATFNLDPALIERRITPKTRAILPVHLYGQMADMGPIAEIARRHKLLLIEDACQSHGASYGGRRAGALGDAGCFSFYYSKNLGAYGEGGIITTNDDSLAERARRLRNHGHLSKYEHTVMGFNSRLDEIQAAILRIRLRHLEEYNERRRAVAARYAELLKDTPLVLPSEVAGRRHVYHLYVVRSLQRDGLLEHLTAAGIGVGIHYRNPVHLQEASRPYGGQPGDAPQTERVCAEILSLPIFPEIGDDALEYVAGSVREFFAK